MSKRQRVQRAAFNVFRPKWTNATPITPAAVRAASASIDNGKCPNDQTELVDGACGACDFRVAVLPPAIVDARVGFHRRGVHVSHAAENC